jgi:site-specific DNA-methyltransferase (adenine-specific)
MTCCPVGGVVYDPFMGSGTTALSVVKSGGGRQYIGSEISREYVDMANKRIRLELAQPSLFADTDTQMMQEKSIW